MPKPAIPRTPARKNACNRSAAGKAERLVHADAEDEQIPERIDDVPEDEQRVGRADLPLAIHHC
jgi:hypothetical protein